MTDTLIRYIARVKQRLCKGRNGDFMKSTLLVNNVNPNNQDGTPNQYHEGVLIWIDSKTGHKYLIKQMELAGVSDAQAQKGFVNSIKLNLGDTYHVETLG